MGYALFAQRKLVLTSLIGSIQMRQAQRSDEQYRLSTNTLTLQSNLSSLQAAQAGDLADLYEQLSTSDSTDRDSIQAEIKETELKHQQKIQTIQNEINAVNLKESTIEMEVKRLDTKLTALQQQLEKIEEAESKGIEKSTPNFKGLA